MTPKEAAIWNKQYRTKLRQAGLCYCGNVAILNTSRCPTCTIRNAARTTATKKVQRLQVYEAYGGSICACCGETELAFLSIDHIDGGVGKHRQEIGGTAATLIRWLIKNNFPAGFQVLCFNCNRGKHINGGICPHQVGEVN
jgi:hypothetical protein